MGKKVNKLFIEIEEGNLACVYTNIDLEVVLIDRDKGAEELTIIRDVVEGESKHLDDLMQQEELYLTDEGIIAGEDNLEIASTFHDYTIYLVNHEGKTIAFHSMGDGTGGYYPAGSVGRQLEYRAMLKNDYNTLLEAYFPEFYEQYRRK